MSQADKVSRFEFTPFMTGQKAGFQSVFIPLDGGAAFPFIHIFKVSDLETFNSFNSSSINQFLGGNVNFPDFFVTVIAVHADDLMVVSLTNELEKEIRRDIIYSPNAPGNWRTIGKQ